MWLCTEEYVRMCEGVEGLVVFSTLGASVGLLPELDTTAEVDSRLVNA